MVQKEFCGCGPRFNTLELPCSLLLRRLLAQAGTNEHGFLGTSNTTTAFPHPGVLPAYRGAGSALNAPNNIPLHLYAQGFTPYRRLRLTCNPCQHDFHPLYMPPLRPSGPLQFLPGAHHRDHLWLWTLSTPFQICHLELAIHRCV